MAVPAIGFLKRPRLVGGKTGGKRFLSRSARGDHARVASTILKERLEAAARMSAASSETVYTGTTAEVRASARSLRTVAWPRPASSRTREAQGRCRWWLRLYR